MKQQRIKMDYACSVMSESKLKALHEFGNTVVNKQFTPEEIVEEYKNAGLEVEVIPFSTDCFWNVEDNCWKVVMVNA